MRYSSGGAAPRGRDEWPIGRQDPVLEVCPTCLPTSPLCAGVTSEEPLERHGRKQRVLSCLSCSVSVSSCISTLAIDLLQIKVVQARLYPTYIHIAVV